MTDREARTAKGKRAAERREGDRSDKTSEGGRQAVEADQGGEAEHLHAAQPLLLRRALPR